MSETSDHSESLRSMEESTFFKSVKFEDPETAARTIQSILSLMADEPAARNFLPIFSAAIAPTSSPDVCLSQFERLWVAAPERTKVLEFLSENPRAVEILTRIFLNSQYLSQILFRVPESIYQFIVRDKLIELKSIFWMGNSLLN